MKRKQFVIFGLGRFGVSVATTLSEAGYEVMVVDPSEEKIQEISSLVTHAVQADATDMDTLCALGIRNFDVAIVAIGKDMQASIMITLLLKEIGIPYVVAKASTEIHQRVLEKLGADRIILPEYEMGRRIATNLISGNIIDYIELSKDYSIVEVEVLPQWEKQSMKDLNIRTKYDINIIAIKGQEDIIVSPGPNYIFNKGDILVAVGDNKALQEIENKRHDA
ncbi:potassium transporter Trk [Sporanaerobium hydrogeniformans]|uniref:Potassium transporter Trk n=1 Tax=Sporanaerobium hydrogeniformans TaxID=3072179 RepID=A0AC61DG31_9FIRM|nr:TrkA family potassium uptake protein [Sporanaerobium hydrogeniformans]PHV71616.1 potassium transporter Trk [Sporanaerobium hydrogeniformans]